MTSSSRQCKRNFDDVTVHVLPGKIQKKRLEILQNCARRHGCTVREGQCTNDVTHILTEFETQEEVWRSLKSNPVDATTSKLRTDLEVQVLNTKWLTDSVRCGGPICEADKLKKYKLQGVDRLSSGPSSVHDELEGQADDHRPSHYACQRAASLDHKNKRLVDALSVLASHAEYRADDERHRDYSRHLAFCKAIAVLKSLPAEVTKPEQLNQFRDIGEHSLRIIQEILEDGRCAEVEDILKSESYQTMKLIKGVYGIGASRGKKLYSESKARTLGDLKRIYGDETTREDERINYGLAFYDDLNTPVLADDALRIRDILIAETEAIQSGVTVTLTGGFRRGKTAGHDADFLLSHQVEGSETDLLSKLIEKLQRKGYILHYAHHPNVYDKNHFRRAASTTATTPRGVNTMDHFEKSFMIFKLPTHAHYSEGHRLQLHPDDPSNASIKGNLRSLCAWAAQKRDWRAVRVDLVVVPPSQFAYALVGWTGNKLFNRSLRQYAKKELNASLTSHGLWDFAKKSMLPAKEEHDVFSNLKLKYLEPHERNS